MVNESTESIQTSISRDAEPSSSEETVRGEAERSDTEAMRPSERLRIGSLRQSPAERPKAKSAVEQEAADDAAPKAPVKAPKSYPPPNIRSKLSPELELELAAALGGESIDTLLDNAATVEATAEIPAETRISGRIAKIHGDDVFVDLDARNQGLLPKKQFGEIVPAVGAPIEVVVVRFNSEEGLYDISLPTAAVEIGNWDDVQLGQIVEVTVTGANKGGLECQVAGLRGFMPMGQISMYRVESPEDFIGQRINAVVTEANRDRRNLVLSHRAVMERERSEQREKLLAELAPGQIREGIVRSLRDFGAFVDLGGIDGLVHVSQLSWDRVGHPSEVLQEGQKIKVRVEKIDRETGKIGLSYRELGVNPWDNVPSKYYVGARVNGTVTKVMDFGAFVKLEPGVEGLIHISELAHGRVFRTSDVVSQGQEVEVKVLSVDRENQRISLSLKALLAKPEKEAPKVADEDVAPPADAPKAPRKRAEHLKGGISGPSGGDRFGLKW